MEITGRHVRTVGRMVQRLPFELVQFYLCDYGDVWTHVIMEKNYTLHEQPQSFILDGPAYALECLTVHNHSDIINTLIESEDG
ncbi:uncharacterized protein TNCV_3470701 [Trichonephila clavipes]|nr:uncharacterized protein TNCV_3470701 [Trichonephila clavipes]